MSVPVIGARNNVARPNRPVQFGAADPKVLSKDLATQLTEALQEANRLGAGTTQSNAPGLATALSGLGDLANKIPLGKVEARNGKIAITSWAEGAPVTTEFPEGQRAIVRGPGTNVQDFLREVVGGEPALVIGPVGWTVPDPDTVGMLNPTVHRQFEATARTLQGKGLTGADYEKALKKEKKALIARLYENAFQQWWEPIQAQLDTLIAEKRLPKNRVVMLTSASYAGVDKAAMDFAERKGLKIANITPFVYAQWMDTSKTYPLLVTNTVKDYADAYADAADVVLVTGGREHALKEDVGRGLIGGKAVVIAADVLQEEIGIRVPPYINGKIENAAAYLQDSGLRVAGMDLANSPKLYTGLRDSQARTVAVLERIFNRNVLPTFERQA